MQHALHPATQCHGSLNAAQYLKYFSVVYTIPTHINTLVWNYSEELQRSRIHFRDGQHPTGATWEPAGAFPNVPSMYMYP